MGRSGASGWAVVVAVMETEDCMVGSEVEDVVGVLIVVLEGVVGKDEVEAEAMMVVGDEVTPENGIEGLH